MLEGRQMALERYAADARARLDRLSNNKRSSSPTREEQVAGFLEEKVASNEALLSLYRGDAPQARLQDFFESSNTAWSVQLPSVLGKLEALLVGPFALGDDLVSG